MQDVVHKRYTVKITIMLDVHKCDKVKITIMLDVVDKCDKVKITIMQDVVYKPPFGGVIMINMNVIVCTDVDTECACVTLTSLFIKLYSCWGIYLR